MLVLTDPFSDPQSRPQHACTWLEVAISRSLLVDTYAAAPTVAGCVQYRCCRAPPDRCGAAASVVVPCRRRRATRGWVGGFPPSAMAASPRLAHAAAVHPAATRAHVGGDRRGGARGRRGFAAVLGPSGAQGGGGEGVLVLLRWWLLGALVVAVGWRCAPRQLWGRRVLDAVNDGAGERRGSGGGELSHRGSGRHLSPPRAPPLPSLRPQP